MSIYLGTTPIASTGYDKANTDLSNLASTGKNIANWSNNVTNCITEIPQDIKLELNNGTLTLKAGSKVYVPNGSGVFDTVTIASDKSGYGTLAHTRPCFMFYNTLSQNIERLEVEKSYSGTTDPVSGTWHVWYDTTNNICYMVSNTGVQTRVSLPFAIVTFAGDNTKTITSIDQVFNGFGYIGSTWFLLPNVKFSVTWKRNEDGSYKTYIIKNSSVKTLTRTSGALSDWTICTSIYNYEVYDIHYERDCYIVNNLPTSGINYTSYFNLQDGIQYYTGSGTTPNYSASVRVKLVENASCDSSGKIIKSGKFLLPFTRVLSINDSSIISGLGMPSSRYIDLTLGASGATYTAPANGYFYIAGTTTSSNGFYSIGGNIGMRVTQPSSSTGLNVFTPAKKGERVSVYYVGINTTAFRFVYAEGEN